jgi:hypothetical protein
MGMPMIRLHRHDELVEAMRDVIDETFGRAYPLLSKEAATAALDALLEAVIAREAGYYAVMKHCRADICAVGEQEDALILRMEAGDDNA